MRRTFLKEAPDSALGHDCNDSDPQVSPVAPETPGDGMDQDCNGVDAVACLEDGDGDGVGGPTTVVATAGDCGDPGESLVSGDCADTSAFVWPGAPEFVADGIDQDCSGADTVLCYVDADGDGFGESPQQDADGDCADALQAAGGLISVAFFRRRRSPPACEPVGPPAHELR